MNTAAARWICFGMIVVGAMLCGTAVYLDNRPVWCVVTNPGGCVLYESHSGQVWMPDVNHVGTVTMRLVARMPPAQKKTGGWRPIPPDTTNFWESDAIPAP